MSTSHTVIAAASRRYFNRWAGGYDRSLAQVWFRENHRVILEVLDPRVDARVLDLGCGTGRLARRVAARVPQGAVLGIDPADEMIRVAARHSGENLRFAVGSSEAIPAGEGAFDAAVSTISFHHWARPAESLREIARVLRPGGRVLILDLCCDDPLMGVVDRVQRWLQPSHAGAATAAEMRAYCAQAGFRDVRITRPRWLLMLTDARLG